MGRSGTLSRMHAKGKIRRGAVNRHPLRKVVGFVPRTIDVDGRQVAVPAREKLECGHEQNPRQDFMGPTYASIGQRRRCRRCPIPSPSPAADVDGAE